MCIRDRDNSAGSAGDLVALVKRGTFLYANSATAAVDADDKGKLCFVEDNQTVAETSTHNCKAGIVIDVTSEGVWVDTTYAHLATVAVTDGTTNGAFTSAADLAAVKTEGELLADFVRYIAAALRTHGIIK